MLLLNLNFFSSRTTNISSTTNSPEVEAPLILQIIHPGGIVERYYMAFPAAFIIQKYPKSVLARPEVFQRPWDSVVRPEEILVPGHKYFVVPILTVKKLRTRMMKSDNNNIFNADAGHETGTKPRRVRFKGGDQAKTRHVDDYDHDSEDNKAKKNKKKKSLNGKGLRKKKNVRFSPALTIIDGTS